MAKCSVYSVQIFIVILKGLILKNFLTPSILYYSAYKVRSKLNVIFLTNYIENV
jgi:hypothetical protein